MKRMILALILAGSVILAGSPAGASASSADGPSVTAAVCEPGTFTASYSGGKFATVRYDAEGIRCPSVTFVVLRYRYGHVVNVVGPRPIYAGHVRVWVQPWGRVTVLDDDRSWTFSQREGAGWAGSSGGY